MTDVLKILRALLVAEMDLPDERCMIHNTKWTLPTGDGLFVLLSFVSAKAISTGKWHEDSVDGLLEVQETVYRDTINVDVFSRSTDARDRRHEVLWAFNGDEAARTCERFSLKISDLPTEFTDLSDVEASGRLYRYQLTFRVLKVLRREKLVPYYSDFDGPDLLIEP